MASILDLPQELLERIFSHLHLGLEDAVQLSQVCSRFHSAAFNTPVPAVIPLGEGHARLLHERQIPVTTLNNREPAMFVIHQITKLNLRRLLAAEIIGNDYVTSKKELSPYYVNVLSYLVQQSATSLRHLMASLDLVRNNRQGFRCLEIVLNFKNLTELFVSFTQNIELEQEILKRNHGQYFLKTLVDNLKKLKNLYIFHCPTNQLVIHSESLVKLHIYKSEFVAVKELKTPNLKKFMLHGNLAEFFSRLKSNYRGKANSLDRELFNILYDGCPNLEVLTTVNLAGLKEHNLTKNEWCYYALHLCLKKYRNMFGGQQSYLNNP